MEFLKERVYTSLNADELRAGDKVITALCMADLRALVESNAETSVIEVIQDETNTYRFTCNRQNKDMANWRYDVPLAYLVERKANCTNCGMKSECKDADIENPELHNCLMWEKPKTEKHYRPFRDTDELIKAWEQKFGKVLVKGIELTMPHIWVRRKESNCKGQLITKFSDPLWVIMSTEGYNMTDLFEHFTFLDGTPCGVEE